MQPINKTLFILIFIIFPSIINAQWMPDGLKSSTHLSSENSDKLQLKIDMTGFFKNNEYSSPIAKGATFPGTMFTPRLRYQIGSQFSAEIGATGLYYSGDQQKDGMDFFKWVHARLQYQPLPNLNFVLGNLYAGVNHRLIEPLYRWELHMTNKPESGIQLTYENKRFFVDTWVNWRRYIERGDSVPEVLTFGLSSSIKLTSPEKRLQLSIPFQTLIYHEGGQIDRSESPLVVAGNIATGLVSDYQIGDGFIKSAGFNIYGLGYYDKKPNPEIRPYDKGWAVYPVFHMEAKYLNFMAGYWHARKFYAFEGEELFASFNPLHPEERLPTRNVVTFKLAYERQLKRMFAFGIHAESYSDLKRKKTDYSFGVFLRLNGEWTLIKKAINEW
ncbi:hypothetical protein [Dysgonomonas sp. 520]|uniref:hypothetical protein n=1 Tax=Dysgonomonas sp. 520 TaxID=2302931 RepID=UPI0013D2B3DC|nr:hypothetical protein [Dysgonomonas sp. 520]NDW10071.1 hypothetical protein [Dysgonomonas sp. 520]